LDGVMKYKGILFDKDGTLIETEGVWAPMYRSVLMRLKGVSEGEANRLLGLAGYDSMTDRVAGGSIIAGGTTAQLVELWWPDASQSERKDIARIIDTSDKQAKELRVTEIVPLTALLVELKKRGLLLGVATNDSHSSTMRHLEQLGISGLFDNIYCADTVAVPKPAGHMIKDFAVARGVEPHEVIMVGDNHHDMQEAVNGGAGYRVAVTSGNSSRDELVGISDVVLDDISELLEHLEGINVL
jgi:phosphoglycolate phosphatase